MYTTPVYTWLTRLEVYHYIKLNSSFNLQKLIYTQKLKTHNITKIKKQQRVLKYFLKNDIMLVEI